MQVLEYLERIEIHNTAWRIYIMHRANEVQQYIIRLRMFAMHKPTSRVGVLVMAKANKLQDRLDTVLSR